MADKVTHPNVVAFTGPFGDKCLALRATKLPDEIKSKLREARGNRGEYFSWDSTSKAYTAKYDPDLHTFAVAVAMRQDNEAPIASDKPKKSRIPEL